MAEVAYVEEEPDGWSSAIARTWSVEQDGGTVRMWGACPRCDHPSETVVRDVTRVMGEGKQIPVAVICRCNGGHDGRPEGRFGCGRGGKLIVELD